jgi:hypothetical protein
MAETSGAGQPILIGASAGGIEALSILVGNLPDDLRAPVVVAQHLDPRRESQLGDILGRPDQERQLTVVLDQVRERALGKAESTSPLADLFVLEQPRIKLFRRRGQRPIIPPLRGGDGGVEAVAAMARAARTPPPACSRRRRLPTSVSARRATASSPA